MVVLGGAGAVWYKTDRTAMVQAVCKAGGPNLSRPPEVDARSLGCTVLGPKQRIAGVLEMSFENSTLFIGLPIEFRDGAFVNDSAWFSVTPGNRGDGAAMRNRFDAASEGACGLRMATVTVEGWMTVSGGGFGHLGQWEREFYADRIVSASRPPEAALAPHRDLVARMPADICAHADRWVG